MRMRDTTGNLVVLDAKATLRVEETVKGARRAGHYVTAEINGVRRALSPALSRARAEQIMTDIVRCARAGWASYEIPSVMLDEM